MPNIQKLMSEEIRRLARREAKSAVTPLLKTVSELKHQITELRKQLKQVPPASAGKKTEEKILPAGAAGDERRKKDIRLTPERIMKIRRKLGLSRKQFAGLLDVYFVSIANWETGKTAPRSSMKGKIETAAKMGKRELKAAMDAKGIVPRHLKQSARTKAPKQGKKGVPTAE